MTNTLLFSLYYLLVYSYDLPFSHLKFVCISCFLPFKAWPMPPRRRRDEEDTAFVSVVAHGGSWPRTRPLSFNSNGVHNGVNQLSLNQLRPSLLHSFKTLNCLQLAIWVWRKGNWNVQKQRYLWQCGACAEVPLNLSESLNIVSEHLQSLPLGVPMQP